MSTRPNSTVQLDTPETMPRPGQADVFTRTASRSANVAKKLLETMFCPSVASATGSGQSQSQRDQRDVTERYLASLPDALRPKIRDGLVDDWERQNPHGNRVLTGVLSQTYNATSAPAGTSVNATAEATLQCKTCVGRDNEGNDLFVLDSANIDASSTATWNPAANRWEAL